MSDFWRIIYEIGRWTYHHRIGSALIGAGIIALAIFLGWLIYREPKDSGPFVRIDRNVYYWGHRHGLRNK